MNKLVLSVSLASALCSSSFAQSPVIWPCTNNTIHMSVYDSFDVAQFGNRFTCYKEAAYQLYDPAHIHGARQASQSGRDNTDFWQSNMPEIAAPIIAAHTNDTIDLALYCSGNHIQPPFDSNGSNQMRTNMTIQLQFPTVMESRLGYLTNDWPFVTNNIHRNVYSDAGYFSTNVFPLTALTYSMGGSNAAQAAGVAFINSYAYTQFIITNYYPGNSNEWYSNETHPGTVIQTPRAIGELQAEGMETNIFTLVIDASALTVSQSNHVLAGAVTRNGNTLSVPVGALRLGMPYDNGTATHTNNAKISFQKDHSISNAFFEVVRLTNCAPGTHVYGINGVSVYTNDVPIGGDVSLNFFHIDLGRWWDKKMLVLDGKRKMRDVSTVDASTDQPFNNLMTLFGSEASSIYPSNTGNASYAAAMFQYEQTNEVQDNIDFSNAQPEFVTFTDTIIAPTPHMRIHFGMAHRIILFMAAAIVAELDSINVSMNLTRTNGGWLVSYPPNFPATNYVWYLDFARSPDGPFSWCYDQWRVGGKLTFGWRSGYYYRLHGQADDEVIAEIGPTNNIIPTFIADHNPGN